jgi:hypothetical protein
MKASFRIRLSHSLILASIMSLGLGSTARAETSWWNSFAESTYEQLRPFMAPQRTPALYPQPSNGVPTQWQPRHHNGFYRGYIGVRG